MSDLPEKDRHLDELVRSLRENGGLTPIEADETLNGSGRKLIAACERLWRSVFVGSFNGQRDNPMQVFRRIQPGEMVYNFSCDFAVPHEDEELAAAVLAFRESASIAKIEAVNQRVEALGGVLIFWS